MQNLFSKDVPSQIAEKFLDLVATAEHISVSVEGLSVTVDGIATLEIEGLLKIK